MKSIETTIRLFQRIDNNFFTISIQIYKFRIRVVNNWIFYLMFYTYLYYIFFIYYIIRSLRREYKKKKRKQRKKEKREFREFEKSRRRDANKSNRSEPTSRKAVGSKLARKTSDRVSKRFSFNPRSFSPGQPAVFIDLHSRGFPFNEWGRVANWQPGWKTGWSSKGTRGEG